MEQGDGTTVVSPLGQKSENLKSIKMCIKRCRWRRKFDCFRSSPNRYQLHGTFVRVALLTAMRSGEITGLTWGQIDLGQRVVPVGRAKTSSGTGRQIPMNAESFTSKWQRSGTQSSPSLPFAHTRIRKRSPQRAIRMGFNEAKLLI